VFASSLYVVPGLTDAEPNDEPPAASSMAEAFLRRMRTVLLSSCTAFFTASTPICRTLSAGASAPMPAGVCPAAVSPAASAGTADPASRVQASSALMTFRFI